MFSRHLKPVAIAFHETFADSGFSMAGAVAYSFVLSLFPFCIFLGALAGYFGGEALAEAAVKQLFQLAPAPVRGLNLERPNGGKPRLNPSLGPLDFSLAHAEGAALIGITRGRAIGVDLEDVRPVRIAGDRRRRILAAGTALNAAILNARSEEEAFVRAWVCLEALAKAAGAGLARTLAALGLRQATAGDSSDVALAVERHLSLTGLKVHDLALAPGRVAAVALERALAMPPLNTFPVAAADIEAFLRTAEPQGSRGAR